MSGICCAVQDHPERRLKLRWAVPSTGRSSNTVQVLPAGWKDWALIVPDDTGALEKVRGENQVRKALEAGMSAVDAFAKFGIM